MKQVIAGRSHKRPFSKSSLHSLAGTTALSRKSAPQWPKRQEQDGAAGVIGARKLLARLNAKAL